MANLSEFLESRKSFVTALFYVETERIADTHTRTKKPCCYWQMWRRSGVEPKAIKSSIRGQAKHDGKLQQWGEQSSRPVFLFIRHPPPPLASASKTGTHSPKHPSSAFHTPVRSKRASEEEWYRGCHSPSRRNPADKMGAEITPSSPPGNVRTGRKAMQPAEKVFTLYFVGSPRVPPLPSATSICERSFWQAYNTSTAITQDNHAMLFDLWKANHWANIDSRALGDINLGSPPPLPPYNRSLWAASWKTQRFKETQESWN